MALVLKVMKAGESSLSEGESRSFDGASISIGRGQENDWVVTDPNRHLSKQHCRFEKRGNAYFIIDTSTNGVFVGDAAMPLGKGNAQALRDGEMINLGPCELKAEFRETVTVAPALFGDHSQAGGAGLDFAMETAPAAYGANPASVTDILGGRRRSDASPIERDGDLATLEVPESDMAAFGGHPQLANHFTAPDVLRPVIPPDWHSDEAALPAEPQTLAESEPDPDFPRPMPRPPVAEAVPASTPLPPPPPPPPVVKEPVEAAPDLCGTTDPVAAFMAGVGLPMEAIDNADQAALMHKMGLAFREAVSGMRELLELRAFLKSEFRIEHTLLRAKENNPLKFSANLDGTLAVLIGKRVTGFLDAPDAIRESLRDIKAHEVALIAGMKTVVADVLEQLSPESVSADVSSSMLPQVHKARCWEKYEQTHQRIMGEQSSGPPLGGKFSAAYTKQFRSL
ncbi:type VI secretion system-associated FHA domain protein TagH [Niveispirillum sp. SYP-B3756]|uniref:type VI secretion system-associated FHA domain protein TagH n=1 Tax=Niveispirillum sp. SYP-B3756 TaxID=2662178 RepID=UPI0012910AE3|nr:type VI secretion system-associated FHA domain protein TagH [Niveispirillum sp. SYP-B3756]MQP66273.1 type VI secretion system-associated FHA domain protein TagH [Niveispirillum sp. SYP-B3756]